MNTQTQTGWVAWFASNPVAANLLMALIMVAGVITAMNLRVEAFPPLPPNSITVFVLYESGSAKSAEEGVTILNRNQFSENITKFKRYVIDVKITIKGK